MYSSNLELVRATHEMVRLFSKFRDYIVNALSTRVSVENQEYLTVAEPLVKYICDRNPSVSMLIQHQYLWEAEILLRCIMEATFRLAFISFSTGTERADRIKEYFDDLPEIERLKQSERARAAFERSPKEPLYDFLKHLILEHDEEDALRKKWPKKSRRILEQKWSFSEIMGSLETMPFGLKLARSASHSYGLSSHLLHADHTGIMLPIDRELREDTERSNLHKAHWARLLSDILSYIGLCCISLQVALKLDPRTLRQLFDEAAPFQDEMSEIGQIFKDYLDTLSKPINPKL